MPKKSVWVEAMKSFSLITQLGVTVIVCVFGCGYVGLMLDKKIGTTPVFSLILIVIGILSAFVSIYKTLRRYFKKRK